MTEMTDSGEEAGIINLLIKLRLEGDVDQQGQMGKQTVGKQWSAYYIRNPVQTELRENGRRGKGENFKAQKAWVSKREKREISSH